MDPPPRGTSSRRPSWPRVSRAPGTGRPSVAPVRRTFQCRHWTFNSGLLSGNCLRGTVRPRSPQAVGGQSDPGFALPGRAGVVSRSEAVRPSQPSHSDTTDCRSQALSQYELRVSCQEQGHRAVTELAVRVFDCVRSLHHLVEHSAYAVVMTTPPSIADHRRSTPPSQPGVIGRVAAHRRCRRLRR
jgi:hypothetical protein